MTYTRQDVICLHLEGSGEYRDGGEVPREFTVPGISEVLRTGTESTRRHLELLADLRALADEGLVEVVTRRVEGSPEERNVYVLTDRGRERVAELRDSLSEATVEVTNGTTELVAVEELGRYFDDHPVVRGLARHVEEGVVEVDRSPGETFVDRSAALASVEAACEATRERGARAVVVAGEAGIGKTRLVEEAIDGAEGVALAPGRCRRGPDEPYAPLVAAFDGVDAAPDLASLLSGAREAAAGDPEAVDAGRTDLFDDVADALRAASTDRPVALFVDNLQWADGGTLALLAHLVETIDEWIYPVLFVVAYRPEALGGGSDAAAFVGDVMADDRTEMVRLEGLDRDACEHLVRRLVGVDAVPDDYLDRLHEATGGNPLFVRETVAMQVDDGALDPTAGAFPEGGAAFEAPDPVAAVVEERLAGVAGPARAVLEAAAVAGERVPLDLLVRVADVDRADVRDYADLLAASRVWTVEGDHVRFTSGLLREAVRDRLADDDERAYHRRVAEALAAGDADWATHAEAAEHYRRAGDAAAAAGRFVEAADRAADVYAHEAAVEHARAALSLAEAAGDDARAAAACRALAAVRKTTGEYDAARERVEQARGYDPGDEERRRLAAVAATVASHRGDLDRALAEVEAALADDPAETRATAELLGVEANAHQQRGDYDAAVEAARRQRAVARSLGAADLLAAARRMEGVVAQQRGEFAAAREHLEAARDAFERVGDDHGAAQAGLVLGNVARHQGDYAAAETQYEAAHSTFREVGDDHAAAKALASRGTVAMERGDLDGAEEYYEAARETFEAVGDRDSVARLEGNLGIVAKRRGDHETARAAYERALSAFEAVGDRHGVAITRNDLGNLALRAGDDAAAREHLEAALEAYRDLSDRHGEAMVLSSLGHVERDAGNLADAREHLEAALAIQRDIGDSREAVRTLRRLAEVALARGDLDAARERGEAALEAVEDVDAAGVGAHVRCVLGQVAIETAAPEAAREHLEAALDGYETMADSDTDAGVASVRGHLAAVETAAGDHDLAREHAAAALERSTPDDPDAETAAWLRRAAEAAAERGEDELVAEWCDRALSALPADHDDRGWFEQRRDGA